MNAADAQGIENLLARLDEGEAREKPRRERVEQVYVKATLRANCSGTRRRSRRVAERACSAEPTAVPAIRERACALWKVSAPVWVAA